MRLIKTGLNTHLVGTESATTVPLHRSEFPKDTLLERHLPALREICAVIPSHNELRDIIHSHSDWWESWRDYCASMWGIQDDSFPAFVKRALRSGHPSLLGSLLVCLAQCTGDFGKYLAPVERWILYADELASCEYGLQCLIVLGLAFLSMLQPHRAWTLYRRANTLLQLQGIHRSHTSKSMDGIFWHLFHADRWMSLILGLPYSIPDNLCDIHIPPADADTTGLGVVYHRRLAVLTGRVIDCLQSPDNPSLSTIAAIDEQINAVVAQLPAECLDFAQISTCQNGTEKRARLLSIAHVHCLKTHLYLPISLQYHEYTGQGYGRSKCLQSSRILLEAFLQLYDDSPVRAILDTHIRFTVLSSFTAAVILFLNLLDGGPSIAFERTNSLHGQPDGSLIARTINAFEESSSGQPTSIYGQCYASLVGLLAACRQVRGSEPRQLIIPYFGVVSVAPKLHDPDDHCHGCPSAHGDNYGTLHTSPAQEASVDIFGQRIAPNELSWNYLGPYTADDSLLSTFSLEGQFTGPQFTSNGTSYCNVVYSGPFSG
ncbi:hypothetical protein BBP40_010083 [Aspergillus hancockii]|nr:hypothetical protein BBP40_010083 [Aspergillus hancockii]